MTVPLLYILRGTPEADFDQRCNLLCYKLIMDVFSEDLGCRLEARGSRKRMTRMTPWRKLLLSTIVLGMASLSTAAAQSQKASWQAQVRKYVEAQDWESAMRLVDQEVADAPQDMDVRAWRARVLSWSGHLPEAEKEYLEILQATPADPDNWMGLAGVYLREGRIPAALRAMDTAEELDPKRADVHAARARVLRAAGDRENARSEFQKALQLDPTSTEARDGLRTVRSEPKHELRFGEDNDVLSFASDYRNESASLASRWTSRWATNVAGHLYQRAGVEAGNFVGSVTLRQPNWGAATVGAAVGHDNAVIPKSEAFFDLDRAAKIGEASFVRALEFNYGQHWYWYQGARILTLTGGAIVYLPSEWTLSVRAMGARSAFTGTGSEWRPSGLARLGFPLARWRNEQIAGNIFFAAGTENFAIVDQIGRFASQTYGGSLKFQIGARQDITGYAGYQRRTQNHTDTNFGLTYAIRF